MRDAILTVEHLTMRFGGVVAVSDLSFQARRGAITAIIGPNGAGKTTVFNCITGFYRPTEGMVTLRLRSGESFLLERLPDHEIARIAKVARTFQAVRMAVNDEPGALEAALPQAARLLEPGGRMGVIAFHSGEDRIVKRTFRRLAGAEFAVVEPSPLTPGDDEVRANPRARSAKLRVLERLT